MSPVLPSQATSCESLICPTANACAVLNNQESRGHLEARCLGLRGGGILGRTSRVEKASVSTCLPEACLACF